MAVKSIFFLVIPVEEGGEGGLGGNKVLAMTQL